MRESEGGAPPFLTSTIWGELISFTPRSLYSGETAPAARWIGGWMDSRANLGAVDKRRSFLLPRIKTQPSSQQPFAVPIELSRHLLLVRLYRKVSKMFTVEFTDRISTKMSNYTHLLCVHVYFNLFLMPYIKRNTT